MVNLGSCQRISDSPWRLLAAPSSAMGWAEYTQISFSTFNNETLLLPRLKRGKTTSFISLSLDLLLASSRWLVRDGGYKIHTTLSSSCRPIAWHNGYLHVSHRWWTSPGHHFFSEWKCHVTCKKLEVWSLKRALGPLKPRRSSHFFAIKKKLWISDLQLKKKLLFSEAPCLCFGEVAGNPGSSTFNIAQPKRIRFKWSGALLGI